MATDNEDATAADKILLDQEPDLDKAIEKLIPQDDFATTIKDLRKTMHGESLNFRWTIQTYRSFEEHPDRVRRCIDIRPPFNTPHRLDDYLTTLKPIFATLAAEFDAETASYRQRANAILHRGHAFTCFQNRTARMQTLTAQLVHNLGCAHIEFYRTAEVIACATTNQHCHYSSGRCRLNTHKTLIPHTASKP
jgi:hypothetical protein